jgi:hypothetical protein
MKAAVKNRILKILEHVRHESLGYHADRQGGVEYFSVPASDRDLTSLIEAGFMEKFTVVAKTQMQKTNLFTSQIGDGNGRYQFYRIGPKGAKLLLEHALEQEWKLELEVRVANRLKGVLPKNILKSAPKSPPYINPWFRKPNEDPTFFKAVAKEVRKGI